MTGLPQLRKKDCLKHFWHKKFDSELRILLEKVDLHLSISEAMSVEYNRDDMEKTSSLSTILLIQNSGYLMPKKIFP